MNNHYNPYEDYDEIIPKDVQQNLNEDYRGIIFGESIDTEEFYDSGATIVYLFLGLLIVAIIAIIYYLKA